jgi:predicted amidophosphoribosyltransferase
MFCVICSHLYLENERKICEACHIRLFSLVYDRKVHVSEERVYVGFLYQSIIRTLILRAKVKNEVPALAALASTLEEVLCPSWVTTYNSPDCLVVPAPSSLWSRTLGRFDLAWTLGLTLFPLASFLKVPLPGMFWRRKRAGRNQVTSKHCRGSTPEMINNFLNKIINSQAELTRFYDVNIKISAASRILVIDDVLTTGLTMGSLFNQLKALGAKKIEGLVLATSDQV